MMLKLKLQYFGHLMQRVDSLEKTLMLGGIGDRRRRGRQRMRWLDGITDSMDVSEWTPGVGDGQGGLACCDSWGCKESDTTEQLNWTETKLNIKTKTGLLCNTKESAPLPKKRSRTSWTGRTKMEGKEKGGRRKGVFWNFCCIIVYLYLSKYYRNILPWYHRTFSPCW